MRRIVAPAALCGWLLLQGCGGEPAAPAAGQEVAEGAASATQNGPPVIEEVALEPARPRPGEMVTARVVAHDPEGDPFALDYAWRVSGRTVDAAAGSSSLHVEGVGRESAIEVTVVARDAHGESQPATAVARVGNLPPSIVTVGMQPEGHVSAGTDIVATPRATDPEGGEIEYHYHWTVNGQTVPVDGPTLPGNLFSRGDTVVLEVVASDGNEESEPVVSPPIPVGNAAPRVVSQPGQISADGIFHYALVAEDPDGDKTFRYRLLKGPRGMAIGFDDGKLEWEPPADAAGTHEVEIEVADLFGGKATYRFSLELSYESVKGQPAQPAAAAKEPTADTESAAETQPAIRRLRGAQRSAQRNAASAPATTAEDSF